MCHSRDICYSGANLLKISGLNSEPPPPPLTQCLPSEIVPICLKRPVPLTDLELQACLEALVGIHGRFPVLLMVLGEHN